MKFFSLVISSVVLVFLLTGCGSICANVYIEDMDKYQNKPSFKVPVKFCIDNNDKISQYCVQKYPDLFTFDSKSAIRIRVSVPDKFDLYNRVDNQFNFSVLLSFFSCGILPAVSTKTKVKRCDFRIDLPSTHIKQMFDSYELIVSNVGIGGLVLPTCQLFSSSNAVFSGRGWGFGESGFWYTEVKFTEKKIEAYSKVLLHLLSTVSREQIENYYLSNVAPVVELLR